MNVKLIFNLIYMIMIKVIEIVFIGYFVIDMFCVWVFYEGMLGLKLFLMFGNSWIEYDIGLGMIVIMNMSVEWKLLSDGLLVVLEVENFDEVVVVFKKVGVKFMLELMDSLVCCLVVVCDLDGNVIVIYKCVMYVYVLGGMG